MRRPCYDRRVIVDFHTHIFPPEVIGEREHYVREDPTFQLLYEDPKAKLATAEDLLRSMENAGIDVSVAVGFAWSNPETVKRQNDYLSSVATKHVGRIVPFYSVTRAEGEAAQIAGLPEPTSGASGLGEIRPENTGFDLNGPEGALLAEIVGRFDLPVLFHVSEPVGHSYAGKEGLAVESFCRFVTAHPDVTAIGAHWAGGLPFYASMPEVRKLFDGNVYVDTAASSLLYDDGIYERVAGLIGAERILFGSDFPLLSQKRSRRRIEESGLDAAAKALILGENAARLLGLPS
jgi:predicted TIM-barrel fold metal-dependent hydrolase